MRLSSRSLARVALALAIAAILWRLRVYLPPHTLPARGDPSLPFPGSDLTPQWAPWLRVAIDTLWRQRTLVFWNPFTNAGAPQFEVPEAGVIGLTTLLGGLAPLEAAVKWSMLAHVVAGMIGTYLLTRRVGVDGPFAAVGAFAFGTGTYLLSHFRSGHLSHIQPLCLGPWAMLLLWSAMSAHDRWWRSAAGGGVICGLQVLEGGTSVFLYTLATLGLLIVTCPGRQSARALTRLIGVGAVAAACCLAVAGPQLLPMLAYMSLTGRSGGLSLAQSSESFNEVAHPFPTVAASALMALGFGWLVSAGRWRAALWLTAVVMLAVAAAGSDAVYRFLWTYFPGFRYQRIPQRALAMAGMAAPPLVAAGVEGAWRILARWRTAGVVAFSVGLLAFLLESWVIAARTPLMADPRVERQQNHAMLWLAEHANGSRIHVWESPNRHWGSDNITVPLQLEAITSYTASEHRDYLPGDFDEPDHRTFLGDSYSNPARFWGLLNVRYILSTVPRSEPGLKLVAEVARCPVEICQPAKSAGPYIYENEQWLPRGWMVQHAVVLIGPPRPVFEAALDVLKMSEFDPVRTVVLQVAPGQTIPQADAAFSVGADLPHALRWGSDEATRALFQVLQRGDATIQAASFSRRNNNQIAFRSPSSGWLVASEKLALYPGWSAAVDGRSADIVRADGVLAAIRVGEGNRIRLSYEPPRFRLGVALLAAMLAIVLAVELMDRRRTPKTDRSERREPTTAAAR